MNKELNEDARTKQDLLYECSSLESKLSNEIIKNEHLEQQCKKQKGVIDKAINNSQYWIDYYTRLNSDERIALRLQENIDILKEVLE
ncbi:MAG: hypothetical protein MSA15_19810 [Clostridium sp.]|nr:hypothetical protein [Clostridium sp.]